MEGAGLCDSWGPRHSSPFWMVRASLQNQHKMCGLLTATHVDSVCKSEKAALWALWVPPLSMIKRWQKTSVVPIKEDLSWPVDLSYLFMTFSRERSHQEQTKEGKLSFLLLLTMYLMIFITSSHIYYIDCIVSNSWAFIWSTEKIDLSWISSSSEEEWSSMSLPNIFKRLHQIKIVFDQLQSSVFLLSFTISQSVNSCWPENWNYGRKLYLLSVNT